MISALSRAMQIMEALTSSAKGMTASEIISALNIEKSVVSRILSTLEKGGYLIRPSSGNTYHPSLKLLALGLRPLEQVEFYDLCSPTLREVADKTGELVQLALVDDEGLIFVAKAEGRTRIRIVSLLGSRAPLHASAVGKLWLSTLSENDALKRALNVGLEAFTPQTNTTIDGLRAELRKVRGAGYAINREETVLGANGIGVPIYNEPGTVMTGALVLVVPAFRTSIDKMPTFLPLLKKAAEDLRGIGYISNFENGLTEGYSEISEVV